MPRKIELNVGQKFGKLTVIEEAGRDKHHQVLWRCICECGKSHITSGRLLKAEKSTSCGCYASERLTVHGQARSKKKTRLYRIWAGMKNRCHNPRNKDYYRYGSAGITVCDEWQSFNEFMEWAQNNGYQDSLTIDRIDCHGKYEPSNCRWVSKCVNNRNKPTTRMIAVAGIYMAKKRWEKLIGVTQYTMDKWLAVSGDYACEQIVTRLDSNQADRRS